MIEKWYKVSCDNCETVINHYIGRKPFVKELIADGAILYKNKIFCCEDCYNKFNKKRL